MKRYTARALALDALIKIERDQSFSHLVLNNLLRRHATLDARDRQLATEIVYGTIQQQRWLDFHLQPFLKQSISKLERWVRQLLRLSLYQILFLDRVPHRAVVHEAVELAGKRGHRGIKGMINGVLRNFLRSPRATLDLIRDPVERLAVQTSHPTWMVKRWVRQYGYERAERICQANNERPPLTLRVNRLKSSRADLKQKLEEEGFTVQETCQSDAGLTILDGGNVIQSPLFKKGYFTIQDESAMLVAPLLEPKSGMRVLDVCAAPGGKTTHLGELMNNDGFILANDVHPHKEKLIQDAVNRLGLTIVRTMVADARQLEKRLDKPFDRILLDAPCSGFGVIRRKPDLKWHKKPEDIREISSLQYNILQAASSLLIPGQRMVYSTCTIDKEENDYVIDRFLESHPNFKEVPGTRKQIFPDQFQGDGFFMLALQKKA